ncbi:hypothetical protein BC826DRAFT_986272, partial [Russula brevipes]
MHVTVMEYRCGVPVTEPAVSPLGTGIWRRKVGENDLQHVKVEAFRGDHCWIFWSINTQIS